MILPDMLRMEYVLAGLILALLAYLLLPSLLKTAQIFFNDIWVNYKLNALHLPGFRGNYLTGMAFPMVLLNFQRGLKYNIRPLQACLGMCTNVFNNAGIIRLHCGIFKPVILLCNAESAEVLLSSTKEVKKSKEYDYISDWLGAGLITSYPDIWRRHRKLLTPTFHFRILDGFQPIMNEHGNILVNILKEEVNKASVPVEIPVTMCALDIISETALGIKLGAQQDRNSDYVQSIFRTTALMTHRILSPWLWTYPTFWLSPTGREVSKHLDIMNKFIRKLIAQRKAALEKEFFGKKTSNYY